MSYEQLRSSLSARLADRLPVGLLHDVLQELDVVASGFDIRKSCTDLITTGELPEVVKIYCAALIVENKAAGTVKGYQYELRRFFDHIRKPFASISTNDIRLYLHFRQQHDHLQKASVEHVRVIINAFFSWLVDEEYLARNPARKIDPIKVQREGRDPIPQIDLEYLRIACKTPREKALIDFLFSTGCRISECAALNISDIDWRDRSVRIRHGKGDKARTTYFNAEAEASLRYYLSSKPQQTEALFSCSRAPYGHVTKEALETEVRQIRSRVNCSVKVVPHALRTTFATTAAGNGMPIEHVQQLLGHSNIATTMRYVKVAQEEAKASHRKIFA